MTLTPEQLDHLTAESAEDGATFVMCSELRELVAAYKRLADADAKSKESSADIGESATTSSLTGAELDALAALEAQASESPWVAWHPEDNGTSSWCGKGGIAGLPILSADRSASFKRDDANFIATSRNAFPALLAMARRLLRIESTWGVKTPETWADIDPSERPRF